ncbi:hypothetical protein MMC18_007411 [Xylographa bjoerkii]|nr:hypothetical protein [Xylographa bjoerkii]MCJ1394532.1 hypothetical protein [Xylographa bjoerkii]
MVWPNKLWGGIASNIVENAELNGYGRSSRTRPSRRQTASHGAGRYDMSGPPPPYNHGPPPSAPSGGGPYMGSDGRMHYPAQHGGGPPPTPPGYRRGGGGGFVNTGGLGESRGYAPADQPPPYTSPHMPMSGSRGRPPSPDYGGYGGGSPGGHPPSHGFDYGGGGGRHTGGPPSRPSFSRPHGPPPSGSRGPSGPYGSFENPYPYGQGPMDLGRGGGPPRSPAYGGGGGGDGASEHGASGYEGSEYGGSGHGEEPIIREVRPRGYGGGGGGGSYGRDRSHTTRGPSTRDYGGYHDYR